MNQPWEGQTSQAVGGNCASQRKWCVWESDVEERVEKDEAESDHEGPWGQVK